MTTCTRMTARNRLRRSLLVLGATAALLTLPVTNVSMPDGGISLSIGAGEAQALT